MKQNKFNWTKLFYMLLAIGKGFYEAVYIALWFTISIMILNVTIKNLGVSIPSFLFYKAMAIVMVIGTTVTYIITVILTYRNLTK